MGGGNILQGKSQRQCESHQWLLVFCLLGMPVVEVSPGRFSLSLQTAGDEESHTLKHGCLPALSSVQSIPLLFSSTPRRCYQGEKAPGQTCSGFSVGEPGNPFPSLWVGKTCQVAPHPQLPEAMTVALAILMPSQAHNPC